uniref:Uncharacterized protein n=1 Tax=Entomoneis paludosa TaxID=265537 RepID=A0A7S2Y6S4_9STRA|mmetsp:Transcript_20093/g.42044  ORF Transcript_20093/g.42044 Transcript_20093/m.42044 type:complete len:161 (+) Transcript_20093:2-484(+)
MPPSAITATSNGNHAESNQNDTTRNSTDESVDHPATSSQTGTNKDEKHTTLDKDEAPLDSSEFHDPQPSPPAEQTSSSRSLLPWPMSPFQKSPPASLPHSSMPLRDDQNSLEMPTLTISPHDHPSRRSSVLAAEEPDAAAVESLLTPESDVPDTEDKDDQ